MTRGASELAARAELRIRSLWNAKDSVAHAINLVNAAMSGANGPLYLKLTEQQKLLHQALSLIEQAAQ